MDNDNATIWQNTEVNRNTENNKQIPRCYTSERNGRDKQIGKTTPYWSTTDEGISGENIEPKIRRSNRNIKKIRKRYGSVP